MDLRLLTGHSLPTRPDEAPATWWNCLECCDEQQQVEEFHEFVKVLVILIRAERIPRPKQDDT